MRFAIYNLYPRLLGNIENWYYHVHRISSMGFSWIYINPITEAGFSGSLYATKSYYDYNPMFFKNTARLYAESEIKKFIEYCNSFNIDVMLDLVINHSSKDSPLSIEKPTWYKRDEHGQLLSPGAWGNGEWVSWGDLAEFDNDRKDDGSHIDLWEYWKELINNNMYLGFKGFRCDAAYKVPSDLWKYIIDYAKSVDNNVIFFAESLGCPSEDILSLSRSGFDYVASSAKWWDFSSKWFLDQYAEIIPHAKYITFIENHDTERVITEYAGNINRVKMCMIFTAIVGEAWVMTYGFEYGASKRCDVVNDTMDNCEPIHYDISDHIKRFISYMKSNEILACSGEIEFIKLYSEEEDDEEYIENDSSYDNSYDDDLEIEETGIENINEDDILIDNDSSIRAFYKYNLDKSERLLIIMNISDQEDSIDISDFDIKNDISFENSFNITELSEHDENVFTFKPYEIHIFELIDGKR